MPYEVETLESLRGGEQINAPSPRLPQTKKKLTLDHKSVACAHSSAPPVRLNPLRSVNTHVADLAPTLTKDAVRPEHELHVLQERARPLNR